MMHSLCSENRHCQSTTTTHKMHHQGKPCYISYFSWTWELPQIRSSTAREDLCLLGGRVAPPSPRQTPLPRPFSAPLPSTRPIHRLSSPRLDNCASSAQPHRECGSERPCRARFRALGIAEASIASDQGRLEIRGHPTDSALEKKKQSVTILNFSRSSTIGDGGIIRRRLFFCLSDVRGENLRLCRW